MAGDSKQGLAGDRDRLYAHLHDTTLQTLELIAGSGRGMELDLPEVVRLAAYEAEQLRELIDQVGLRDQGRLEQELRRAVWEARRAASCPIELVWGPLEGDTACQEAREIAAAAREALTNACTHSQATSIVVYGEVCGGRACVSVKDDGAGFAAGDARPGFGLRHSIAERMRRLGGRASIDTSPGGGTMVMLELDLAA